MRDDAVVKIYALIDPRDSVVRYIGATTRTQPAEGGGVMDSVLSERDEYIVKDERRECDCWPGKPRDDRSFLSLEEAATCAREWLSEGIPAGIVRLAPTQLMRVIQERDWPNAR